VKAMVSGLFLVFVTSALAQQLSSNPPVHGEHSIFHQAQAPRQWMPPDTKAPPPQRLSTARVEREIQKRINSNPSMATANVNVRADDSSVVLSGTVDNDRQHDLALLIANSWAGKRKVVDQTKQRT
jgi:osmotically-inducible protein OsmY